MGLFSPVPILELGLAPYIPDSLVTGEEGEGMRPVTLGQLNSSSEGLREGAFSGTQRSLNQF